MRTALIGGLFALVGAAGCTSTPQLPTYDPVEYGLGACPVALTADCRLIADRTFFTAGPNQVEYHGADGRAWLWIGENITPGYWVVRGNRSGKPILCYTYPDFTGGETSCKLLGLKGSEKWQRRFRNGDLFDLEGKTEGPFNLRTVPFRESMAGVERRYSEVLSNTGATDDKVQ